jgi:phage/plasmid-like protein (TIGR03299 family)
MLARIPGEYRAGPDDLIKPYILLVNSHDGTSSLRMIPTSIRVVCQNTLNLALGQAGIEGLSIRHHPNLDQRVAEARAKLGIVASRFDRFDEELHAMLAVTPTSSQVDDYFQAILPPAITDRQKKSREENLGTLYANFDNDRNSLPGVKHTAWGLYNSVSEWTDHGRRVRGKTELARLESRLDSIWFGSSHRIKQAAYRSALELAGVK